MDEVAIQVAIMTQVETILTDANLWDFTDAGAPYTVYTDFEIEAMSTEPTRPYIIVMTRNSGSIPKWLPAVGIDVEIDDVELQLGTTSKLARTTLNVMGRYLGEAGRIASVIKANMRMFSSGGTVITAAYTNGALWHEEAVPIPASALKERSLAQWIAISAGFKVL